MDNVYILMATYNGEKYIKEQINSILSQTYDGWILLIRDDVSCDETLKILKEYERQDDRIKIIKSSKRLGARGNFNYLIDYALKEDAQYIMFSDQDDIWLNDKIECSLKKMKEIERENDDRPIMVYGNYEFVDEKLRHLSYANRYNDFRELNRNNTLFLQNSILGATMMINRILAKSVINIPDVVDYHDRWISVLAASCGEIAYLNKVVEQHRIHDNNATQNNKTDSCKERFKRLIRFVKDHDLYWRELAAIYRELLLRIELCNLSPNDSLKKYEKLLNVRGVAGIIFIIKHNFFMIHRKQTLWLLIAMLLKKYRRNVDG